MQIIFVVQINHQPLANGTATSHVDSKLLTLLFSPIIDIQLIALPFLASWYYQRLSFNIRLALIVDQLHNNAFGEARIRFERDLDVAYRRPVLISHIEFWMIECLQNVIGNVGLENMRVGGIGLVRYKQTCLGKVSKRTDARIRDGLTLNVLGRDD